MAAYGTLVAWAKAMGHNEAAELLEEILEEEKAADEKLTELADGGSTKRLPTKHIPTRTKKAATRTRVLKGNITESDSMTFRRGQRTAAVRRRPKRESTR